MTVPNGAPPRLEDVLPVQFQDVADARGRLTAVESGRDVPFGIARVFYVHQVVPGVERGGHAHRDTDQVLSCVHGRMKVDVTDGRSVRTFHLANAGDGIFVPRMLWTRLYDFEDDAVLAVYANTLYDRGRSIREWGEYADAVGVARDVAVEPGRDRRAAAVRRPARGALPRLLAESALAIEGVESMASIDEWLAERRQATTFAVERRPLSQLRGWQVQPDTGNVVHRSGKFFQVVGLDIEHEGETVRRWSQPIVNQPEVGILGFLAREIDGVLHLLVQAKMEPGNVNLLQLSPTVQATRSNFTQVHGGFRPPFLDYFLDATADDVIVDQLQSEQGLRFLRKRNRNVVVLTSGNQAPPNHEDFRWMTLGQLRHMYARDNVVNMDSRSVLAALPYAAIPAVTAGAPEFATAVRRSHAARETDAVHATTWIVQWLTAFRARHPMRARIVPLRNVAHWSYDGETISHERKRYFEVIGVSVQASSREVVEWDQPLVRSRPGAVAGLICREIGGVLHFLVQARAEPGYQEAAELGPTAQFTPDDHDADDPFPPFAAQLLSMAPDRIRYDGLQSEEGGRFFQDVTRYVVAELGPDDALDVPDTHCWVTLRQLTDLLVFPGMVNVELRSLLACVGYGPLPRE